MALIEEWRDIKGYEGKYKISSYGRVKSLNYKNSSKEGILSTRFSNCGYEIVTLNNKGKKTYTIHHLVAEAFLENPNNLPQINHKDENKANNKVENLEYCTAKYNNNYGTKKDRLSKMMSGENHPMYGKHHSEKAKEKISNKTKKDKNPRARKIICITTGEKFDYIKQAAEKYNIKNKADISKCCKGKRKTCGGMEWGYLDEGRQS